MDLKVSCIKKSDRYNVHERITHIGGVANGTRWSRTQAEAITEIERGTNTFYVDPPNGRRVRVIVARTGQGHKYLKTEADGELPNNLLSLQPCP